MRCTVMGRCRSFLACLVIAGAAAAGALPAAAAAEGWAGSIAFQRSFDETHSSPPPNEDISQSLRVAESWTLTLGERLSADRQSDDYNRYRATISGTMSFVNQESFGGSALTPYQGSYGGSGPAVVRLTLADPDGSWNLSVEPGPGLGLPGSQSQPSNVAGQDDDPARNNSKPWLPVLAAIIVPGTPTTARSVTTCAACGHAGDDQAWIQVGGGWPEDRYTLALDTLAYRPPDADLSVTVGTPREALVPGRPFAYPVTVFNHGPGVADAVNVAAKLGEELTVLGAKGAALCTGLAQLQCAIGTLPAGQARTIEVVAIPRHPAVKPAASSRGSSGTPRAVAVGGRARAEVAVTSTTTDPVGANNAAAGTVRVAKRTIARGRPTVKRRRPRATSPGMAFGWFNPSGYWYGLNRKSQRQTGYAYQYGGFTVGTRMFQSQAKQRFGFWPEQWMQVEYRVSVAALTQTGAATYTTVFPNGRGAGKGSGGLLGSNPSWKITAKRRTTQSYDWAPGLTEFAFRTPGERYVLTARFRYFRDRIGPRDKLYDSGWVYIDSGYSGAGY